MLKIIYAFLTSILVGGFALTFLIAISIKLLSAIAGGLFVSNVLLIIFYFEDIINNNNIDDLIYVSLYIAASCVYYIIIFIRLFIKNGSKRCICLKCRHPSYEEIKNDGN